MHQALLIFLVLIVILRRVRQIFLALFMQLSCSDMGERHMLSIYSYFVQIKPGRLVLWCYLIWYLVTLYFHFDPSPTLWINSVGISVVIGTALMLSVSANVTDYWQTFRLYWMPFAVSSFAALIKNKHYFVIFSSDVREVLIALGCCGLFLAIVAIGMYSAPS